MKGRIVIVYDSTPRSRPLDDIVRIAVRELRLTVARGPVRHHCPGCGSSDHGRPRLPALPGQPAVHVSIARCAGRAVVALTDAGRIGIDVEPSGAAGSDAVDAVIGSGPGDPTRRWVRAEALLKAIGCGLPGASREQAGVGPVWTSDVDLGSGHEAAVAVLTSGAPEVCVTEVVVGARSD